ncbi:MAG: BsuPI-related putative proteinase inhibitor, partial [Dehalococcoidia bacterium]
LFRDGRYMTNLAQYSAGGYQIGSGTFVKTTCDTQDPPATVYDAQIRAEIRAQIAAQHLPAPNQDSVYFVFTPPHVIVVDPNGDNSVKAFAAYHDCAPGSDGFAYGVVPYDDTLQGPPLMTVYASGALAAAITDPEPASDKTLGWYDNNYGEIEAIPQALFDTRQNGISDRVDRLVAPDGTPYLVAKVWSNQAGAPVAFISAAGLAVPLPAGALQLELTAGRSAYSPGPPVVLTLTVTNPGSAPATLAFPSSQQYDFEVRLGERVLWRWSAERAFLQALTQRTMVPGERWVVTETWNGRDDQGQVPAAGTYGAVACLTSPANTFTAALPLRLGECDAGQPVGSRPRPSSPPVLASADKLTYRFALRIVTPPSPHALPPAGGRSASRAGG